MSALTVVSAVYGCLCGDENQMHARDVTQNLQVALDRSDPRGVVNINNDSMGGDPCNGKTKAFGAIVSLDGENLYFACLEGQTVDFFHSQAALAKTAAEKE